MPATVDIRRNRGGAVTADALLEPWFSSLRSRLGGIRIFDAHTPLGCADPDGSCLGAAELRGALGVVDARAVVFPLAETGSYRAANDRILAAAAVVLRAALAGAEPRDAGPAPMTTAPAPGPLPERVHTLLVAAAVAGFPVLP